MQTILHSAAVIVFSIFRGSLIETVLKNIYDTFIHIIVLNSWVNDTWHLIQRSIILEFFLFISTFFLFLLFIYYQTIFDIVFLMINEGASHNHLTNINNIKETSKRSNNFPLKRLINDE